MTSLSSLLLCSGKMLLPAWSHLLAASEPTDWEERAASPFHSTVGIAIIPLAAFSFLATAATHLLFFLHSSCFCDL